MITLYECMEVTFKAARHPTADIRAPEDFPETLTDALRDGWEPFAVTTRLVPENAYYEEMQYLTYHLRKPAPLPFPPMTQG